VQTATSELPVDQDIPCPLCGYNLRGLPEARCPECGGKFDWPDLTDPTRKLHPYLFEHHPRKNIRSFVRTVIGGFSPRHFWRTLHPSQPSRPRRLILYWLIVIVLSLLFPVLQFVLNAAQMRQRMIDGRQRNMIFWRLIPPPPGYRGPLANNMQLSVITSNWPSVQAYVDMLMPQPTLKVLFHDTTTPLLEDVRWAGLAKGNFLAASAVFFAAAMLVWPFAAMLALMLLRTTMRQASVRRSHLLRVAIYSGDAVLLVWMLQLLPFVISLLAQWNNSLQSVALSNLSDWLVTLLHVAPLMVLTLVTYRFAVAIHSYLCFCHAIAVAVCVQAIFVLLVLQAMALICG
jgi:hypothetical protein